MKIFNRENPLAKIVLEYEKIIISLKCAINEREENYLNLLKEFREYRESTDAKLMALNRPDAYSLRYPRAKGTMEPAKPKIDSLPVTKERLEELFNARQD